MKTSKKILIFLLIIGIIVCVAGFAMAGFKMSNLNAGGPYETKTFETQERVSSLRIDVENSHVSLLRAEAGSPFKATYEENKRYTYEASYLDGAFSLTSVRREWYKRIFDLQFTTPRVNLYLNEELYDEIILASQNGSITSESELSAKTLTAQAANGKVVFKNAAVAGNAAFSSDNGKITLENITGGGELTAFTSNGSISLLNISAGSVTGKTSNSGITADSIAASKIFLKTSNGKVNANRLDAAESIELYSGNGSVYGTVQGRREDFLISSETSVGTNSLGNTDSGEKRLTVKTNNGKIDVSFLG